MGDLKFKSGDCKGAMENFNQVIELNPKHARAYKNRGKVKAFLEDYRGSVADFSKAIEINASYSNAYYDRGVSLFNLKQYQEAIADFDQVIAFNPNDVHAYFSRGNAKYYSGDKNGGCLDWSKAGEMGHLKAYETIKKNCN